MAHGRPWYKRNGGDFLMATIGFPSSDHRWAYSAILDMLNDRDRPIADEPGFICGFTGLSRKKWASVRTYLMAEGYLVEAGPGYLTNPRFERERQARLAEIERAREDGAKGGKRSAELRRQSELDLGQDGDMHPPAPLNSQDKNQPPPQGAPMGAGDNSGTTPSDPSFADKCPESRPINSPKVARSSFDATPSGIEKPQENPTPPSSPRARERASEAREVRIIHPNDSLDTPREGPERPVDPDPDPPPAPTLRNADLIASMEACVEAAGFYPRSPGEINREVEIIRAWRDLRVDFDAIVIPTIRALCSASTDPTSSLKRFDRQVRHEHARSKSKPNGNGHAQPQLPAEPITRFDDEPPEAGPIRQAMLKRLGKLAYAAQAHSIRLAIADGNGPHERVLHVHARGRFSSFWNDANPAMMRAIAKAHGLADAWKGR